MCLDVSGGHAKDGNHVLMQSCAEGNPNQMFLHYATAAPAGSCARQDDCTVSERCRDPDYVERCAEEWSDEPPHCPEPECIVAPATTTTEVTTTTATTATETATIALGLRAADLWNTSGVKELLGHERPAVFPLGSSALAVEAKTSYQDTSVAVSVARAQVRDAGAGEKILRVKPAVFRDPSNEAVPSEHLEVAVDIGSMNMQGNFGIDVLVTCTSAKELLRNAPAGEWERVTSDSVSVAIRADNVDAEATMTVKIPWRSGFRFRKHQDGEYHLGCGKDCRGIFWDDKFLTCECSGRGLDIAGSWAQPRASPARRSEGWLEEPPVYKGMTIVVPADMQAEMFHSFGMFIGVLMAGFTAVFAAGEVQRRRRKEAELDEDVLFCGRSLPKAMSLPALIWVCRPDRDTKFPSAAILCNLRAAREEMPAHEASLFSFMNIPGNRIVWYLLRRDHPLQWLWGQHLWITPAQQYKLFLSHFSLMASAVTFKYLAKPENMLQKQIDEMSDAGLTPPDLFSLLSFRQLGLSEKQGALTIAVFGALLTNVCRRLIRSSFEAKPVKLTLAETCEVSRAKKKLIAKRCIGNAIVTAAVISWCCLGWAIHGHLTKHASSELRLALLLSFSLSLVVIPAVKAVLVGAVLERAKHCGTFDRALALLAMQMNFVHEYEADPTRQAQILMRDIADHGAPALELGSCKGAARGHGGQLPERPEGAGLADT